MTYDFNKIRKQAIEYTQKGLMCLPSAGNEKRPIVKWQNLEKISAGTTANYFDKYATKRPGIAILTGERSNGLVVIDIDMKNGHNGLNSIHEWERQHGYFPETWQVETPSGGIHLYFKAKGQYKTRTGILEGVDIRAEGGLVIAPPTERAGKPYKFVAHDLPIAEANDSVLKLLELKERKKENLLPQEINIKTPSDTVTVLEGGRTSYLVSIIGQQNFKGNKINKDHLKSMIREINQTDCKPPLTDQELEKEVFPAIDNLMPYEKKENNLEPTTINIVTLDDVEPKSIEWLIPQWIPKGKICLLGGDGGLGKTIVWCHIIACLSADKPCFFEDPTFYTSRGEKKCLILSSEDELDLVLAERLKANGANMKNIKSVPYTDPNFSFLKFNSELLKNLILEYKPDIVVFDPLQSFVPPLVNMGYRNQMRDVLGPLVALGTETGTSMLITMHTNKRTDTTGRGRFADSSDIYDIARSAFLLGRSKQGSLYLDHAKSNYAPMNQTVLFEIDKLVPRFIGSTDKKDYDFVTERKLQKSAPAKDEAKQLIVDILKDQGEIEVKDLMTQLEEAGISKATSRRAKDELSSAQVLICKNESQGDKKGVKRFISLCKG